MATFNLEHKSDVFDPGAAARIETERRRAVENTFDQFFDPSVDKHSAFYMAMERDKHAAHIVAGTAFVELNSVVLRTECNNSYESMNEDDMQNLRKLMWEVYVPHMKETLKQKMSENGDTENTSSFQAQMYVVHLSVRVAQALQLVFELNQKKTFSAVATAAYEMALQDVLYHPSLMDRIEPEKFEELIHFLRRHPTYATAFNSYVGYKLLRQQLVRGGGAGTNRKSNDAERLHDEAANKLWDVFDKNKNVVSQFQGASEPFKMKWHRLYYKEVAQTLYTKLSKYGASDDTTYLPKNQTKPERDGNRAKVYNALHPRPPDTQPGVVPGGVPGVVPQPLSEVAPPGIDIVSAINESRGTVSEGPAKRPRSQSAGSGSVLGLPVYTQPVSIQGRPVEASDGPSTDGLGKIACVRSAYKAWFT
jgi:hypothetical protein